METLSIRQPWAWLICQGIKTVENRTWATHYRGPLLIHAAKTPGISQDDFEDLLEDVKRDYGIVMPRHYDAGGIVGVVELVDCLTACTSPNDVAWHEPEQYAFVLRKARPLPFFETAGKLHIFDVDYKLP